MYTLNTLNIWTITNNIDQLNLKQLRNHMICLSIHHVLLPRHYNLFEFDACC